MRIVIQCAATKVKLRQGMGIRTGDGRMVNFVAHPELSATSRETIFARPDDFIIGESRTWRDYVSSYNKNEIDNPLGLFQAYELYSNDTYRQLVDKFGKENIFILSAGWGLVPATFFLPHYDVTFSSAKNVSVIARRRKQDLFSDFCILPDNGDDLVFIGGKEYLPLFCNLTKNLQGSKKFFFNSQVTPHVRGFSAIKFETNQRTNWHYQCAKSLIDGKIVI